MRRLTLRLMATLFLLGLLAFVQKMQAQMAQSAPLTFAEKMPFFPGCDTNITNLQHRKICSDKALIAFITNNLIYPETAKSANIEGTVLVSFVVDEQGFVTQPALIKNIGGGCGEAALDILRTMPQWEPAENNGTTVKVKLHLPIYFSLHPTEPDPNVEYKICWGHLPSTEVTKSQLIQNLNESLYVRDPLGNNLLLDELTFVFEKNNQQIVAKSRGKITKDLKKVVERVRHEGIFYIEASVQDKGRFFKLSKQLYVVK